jgi:glycosyltransferase involved in cell wall biosynthesis
MVAGVNTRPTQLRISMLAPFGIRPKGTLAVRMLPLAQALVRRGHRVHIIAPPVNNPQDAGSRTEHAGVYVTHTAQPTLPAAAGVAHQVAMLYRAVVADTPDIVHLFKPKGYSGLAALLLRWHHPQLPLVVDTDDWEGWGGWNDLLDYPLPAKMLFAWQERDLPRRATIVTVASRTLQTQVWGAGVPPARVIYLPNGVLPSADAALLNTAAQRGSDAEQMPTHNHRPTLLLYTRFWEFDVRDIVAALVAILAHAPDVRLLVIGKGERGEEHNLLRLSQHAGVAHAIDYRGWVEPAAIPSLLATADIALAPLDDTLINRARCSVKVLELMAAGLPIVAGNVGQMSEYLAHNESGLLVPPTSPTALAQATLRLLHDAPLRTRLGAAARQRATSLFHWDTIALAAEQAYGQTAENGECRMQNAE